MKQETEKEKETEYHTIGAKVEMEAVKIQTWWRKLMTGNFQQHWDASAEPPNWGHSFTPEKTISLEEYSEDEWESLYNEAEIQKEKV